MADVGTRSKPSPRWISLAKASFLWVDYTKPTLLITHWINSIRVSQVWSLNLVWALEQWWRDPSSQKGQRKTDCPLGGPYRAHCNGLTGSPLRVSMALFFKSSVKLQKSPSPRQQVQFFEPRMKIQKQWARSSINLHLFLLSIILIPNSRLLKASASFHS